MNGQMPSGQNIYAGAPQGSVLESLLFLIYSNNLLDGLSTMCNIFSDDKSLFSIVIDENNPSSQLNSDLAKTSKRLSNGKCLSTLIHISKL